MRRIIAALSIYVVTLFTSATASAQDNPVVVMETNKGTIKIEVWQDRAPLSAANFLRYIDENYYDGLIFHRVIPGFMAQGGGFDEDMVQKSTIEMIKNEASTEMPNKRGTLAMARTNVVDSATSQFFINLVDNDFLNHTDNTPRGFGYAVFAEVIEGMEIVDTMAAVKTANKRGHQNVPVDPIVMTRVARQQ